MKDLLTQNNQDIDHYLSQVNEVDIDRIIDVLGIQKCSQGYRFDFFNRPILYDKSDFIDLSGGEVLPAIKGIFCQYLLKSPPNKIESSGRLVTFREFSEAGPLFSRFTENTNKTIEQTFSNRQQELEQKCKDLFGMTIDKSTYDLSIRFKALPKIPLIFQFNDVDEILPATSTFLFHDDAEKYLDLKSLAAIGTYLTGLLIY